MRKTTTASLIAAATLFLAGCGTTASVWDGYDPTSPFDLVIGTPLRLCVTPLAMVADVVTLGGLLSPSEAAGVLTGVAAGTTAASNNQTYTPPYAPPAPSAQLANTQKPVCLDVYARMDGMPTHVCGNTAAELSAKRQQLEAQYRAEGAARSAYLHENQNSGANSASLPSGQGGLSTGASSSTSNSRGNCYSCRDSTDSNGKPVLMCDCPGVDSGN